MSLALASRYSVKIGWYSVSKLKTIESVAVSCVSSDVRLQSVAPLASGPHLSLLSDHHYNRQEEERGIQFKIVTFVTIQSIHKITTK